MKSRKIRTAIVGCGKVGHIHAQALVSMEESHFVAVCDSNLERASKFAKQYNVTPFQDLQKMLIDKQVQMVSICTPHPLHPMNCLVCCRAGVHVLVEKPMAVDLKSCDRMIAEAENAGVTLGVISQRRLYEPVKRVKQAIDAGKIGKPILCSLMVLGWRDEAYYSSDPWRGKWETEGGGVLVNQTPHHLDLLQWFMGPIRELFGYWENFNHPYLEVEDTAVAVLLFKSGALGTILLSNSQNPGLYSKIHIHGENGASVGVQTDVGSPFIAGVSESVVPPINDLWTVPGEEDLLVQWQAEDRARSDRIDFMTHYHHIQIQDFLNALLENREPCVTGREGRKHVEIFTAIYRSQRDKQLVRFPLDGLEGSHCFDGRYRH